ncbi:MAG: DUF3616 domain-containing protein [Dongiaceae bacterium]
MFSFHRAICLSGLVVSLAAAPAWAGSCEPWPVDGKLLGKDDKKSRDQSGIACLRDSGFPRSCLVIDDEIQSAQLVTLQDGAIEAGATIPLIDDQYKGKPLELDGEGVAYAAGFYYVTGSHGSPRHAGDAADDPKVAARIAADSQVVRIAVDPASGAPVQGGRALAISARLGDVIRSVAQLRPYAEQPLDENGVTIEGLAAHDGRLLFGFRGPSLDGRAAVLSVSATGLFAGGDADPSLRLLPLGAGRGVRDIAAYGGGFLVLAGPTADGGGTYSVFAWDGTGESVRKLGNLPAFDDDGTQLKAEALLPLDAQGSQLRVLVLFDGGKEGAPQACLIDRP